MSEKQVLTVEILGRAYQVRAETNAEYTQELARYVEGQMREVAEKATADSLKVAILAALNIANDLFQARKAKEEQERWIQERADALLRMVEEEA